MPEPVTTLWRAQGGACHVGCVGTWPGGAPYHVRGCPQDTRTVGSVEASESAHRSERRPGDPLADRQIDGPVDDTWLCFDAHGVPAMQGSKRHVGRGIMVEASKRTRPWREAVKTEALDAMRLYDRMLGPVEVRLLFCHDRPRAHYRTGRNGHLLRGAAPLYPANRGSGDCDKAARAVLDSCTDAGVFADDAQVVVLIARKVWCGEHEDALRIPGVRVRVREMGR